MQDIPVSSRNSKPSKRKLNWGCRRPCGCIAHTFTQPSQRCGEEAGQKTALTKERPCGGLEGTIVNLHKDAKYRNGPNPFFVGRSRRILIICVYLMCTPAAQSSLAQETIIAGQVMKTVISTDFAQRRNLELWPLNSKIGCSNENQHRSWVSRVVKCWSTKNQKGFAHEAFYF